MICLINQGSYILRRKLEGPEQNFLKKGGFTEQLYQERLGVRNSIGRSDEKNGGERGIRTLGPVFRRNTRFPVVPLQPLGHLSQGKCVIWLGKQYYSLYQGLSRK